MNYKSRFQVIWGKQSSRSSTQISINKFEKCELHLIGPLQSNKVKNAMKIFDVIQSIDRFSLVDEIKQSKKLTTIKTKNFFIQVNIGDEDQKSGVHKRISRICITIQ